MLLCQLVIGGAVVSRAFLKYSILIYSKQQIIIVIAVNSAKMDSVAILYKDLKAEWDKSGPNLRKCGSLLDQLKVC